METISTNSKGNRIRLLDILRGFAIIGTLGTNIWLFADPGAALSLLTMQEGIGTADAWVHGFLAVFTNGKFLGLLTIMFGIGLELKYQKSLRNGRPWLRMYSWTMILLGLDGLLHFVFVFEYDVLMSYAFTGIIVAFLVGLRHQTLNWIMAGAATIHIIGLMLISVAWVWLMNAEGALEELIGSFQETETVYTTGTYLEQIQFRLSDVIGLRFEAIAIVCMNMFLYLLGIRLYRAGAFSQDEKGRAIRKRLMVWGLGLGIPLNTLVFVPGNVFDLASRYLFAPVLSLGYIGLLAFILEKNVLKWILARFEMIGKTALSCYVLQNILGSILFYSWGLGLAPVVNVYQVLAAWAGITAVMMIVAQLFVKYFGVGPLEWIWRKCSNAPFKKVA
ncbi:DUF418 domain-containing protein [Alkalihalobacillus sp. FSL R5-0424]